LPIHKQEVAKNPLLLVVMLPMMFLKKWHCLL